MNIKQHSIMAVICFLGGWWPQVLVDVSGQQISGAYVQVLNNNYKDFDTSFNPNQGGLFGGLFYSGGGRGG